MNTISWKDPSLYVDTVYVEESCLEFDYTHEILERIQLPYSVIKDTQKPNNLDIDFSANLTLGKKQIFLCQNRGIFFKPCPGTREYQCCDYQVLTTGLNCPIDCSYCILQAYLNTPWLTCYVNIDKLFDELDTHFKDQNNKSFCRVGTGEFTDSLALDRFTCLSKKLVNYFNSKSNAILELKTKSGVIQNLAGLNHNGRTIVAWSLNSPSMMKNEEIRSATLDERLEAASKCAAWGYKLAFHFDPIIAHTNWEKEYGETIDKLFAKVPAAAIRWISLGALRYIPYLKQIGTQRFPSSDIYFDEFVMGLDGKSRYFRPNRVKLYKHIYDKLKEKASNSTCIYFCMENDEIWQEVMGFVPGDKGGLPLMLDKSVS